MAAGPVHFAKLEALLRDITDRAERRGIRNLTLMKHLRDILEGTYQMQMMSHRGVPGFAITPAEAEQDLFEIVHLAYLLGSMCPDPFKTEAATEAANKARLEKAEQWHKPALRLAAEMLKRHPAWANNRIATEIFPRLEKLPNSPTKAGTVTRMLDRKLDRRT